MIVDEHGFEDRNRQVLSTFKQNDKTRWHSIVVGTSSTMMWEMLFLGIPVLSFVVVDNQQLISDFLLKSASLQVSEYRRSIRAAGAGEENEKGKTSSKR